MGRFVKTNSLQLQLHEFKLLITGSPGDDKRWQWFQRLKGYKNNILKPQNTVTCNIKKPICEVLLAVFS